MSSVGRVVVFIFLAAVLTGCRQEREPLRVGLLVWPPYDLAYLAKSRGYIDENAFEFVEFQTPSEIVRSYRHDLIDAMFVTTHFALSNIEGMSDTRIVYAVNFSYGGDALLAQPGIETAADLKGKRIGVEAAPLGAYVLIRSLGLNDLTLDDIEVVFIDTPDQLLAFEQGRVDAVAAYEPTRTRLIKAGANEIFNSRSIPLEIIDVMLTRDDTIENSRDRLAQLVSGMDHALADYRESPERISEALAKRHGIGPNEFISAMNSVQLLDLETNVNLLTGRDERLKKGLLRQCRVMKQAGLVRVIPDLEPLLDSSVVLRAESVK